MPPWTYSQTHIFGNCLPVRPCLRPDEDHTSGHATLPVGRRRKTGNDVNVDDNRHRDGIDFIFARPRRSAHIIAQRDQLDRTGQQISHLLHESNPVRQADRRTDCLFDAHARSVQVSAEMDATIEVLPGRLLSRGSRATVQMLVVTRRTKESDRAYSDVTTNDDATRCLTYVRLRSMRDCVRVSCVWGRGTGVWGRGIMQIVGKHDPSLNCITPISYVSNCHLQ